MDSLQSILQGKIPQEAPEIGIIKRFVFDQYKVTPKVAIRDKQYIISVPSAALAGALRPHLLEIQQLCGAQNKILLRIE